MVEYPSYLLYIKVRMTFGKYMKLQNYNKNNA